jgi:hypothetical protein
MKKSLTLRIDSGQSVASSTAAMNKTGFGQSRNFSAKYPDVRVYALSRLYLLV